ncbi:MAG: hypothetical protein HZA16_15325 [Nitrospirae bacterium]|nr:hypothetical protein [Nitrospirota bacterium]
MRLGHHIAFSTAVSGVLYMISRSWGLATACFLSGIFIDLDHVIDFLLIYGWPFSFKRFFNVFYHEMGFKKIYLLFHAWEWLLLLFAAAWASGWDPWLTGLFAGCGHHMFLDYLHNGGYIRSYSIIWRWKNRFDFKTSFPGLFHPEERKSLESRVKSLESRVKS